MLEIIGTKLAVPPTGRLAVEAVVENAGDLWDASVGGWCGRSAGWCFRML